MKGNIYCKIEHNSGLNAYILCSAESLKDAELNLFEDNELYSDLLEDKTFLDSLKSDLIEFFE